MAGIGTCIKETFKIGFHLLLYLILEVSVFALIVAASGFLTYWIFRAALILSNADKISDPSFIELYNILRAWFICWLIGILTLKWIESWSSLMTPKRLQKFMDEYALLCAWLRSIISTFLLIVCTCLQICSYFTKFYRNIDSQIRPQGRQQFWEELEHLTYINDLKFLGSLCLLVYLSVRIFRFYRDVNKTKVNIRAGEIVRSPKWQSYWEDYYGLLGYEVFLADLALLVIMGMGVILQDRNKLDCLLPYVASVFVATGLGVVLGDVEERLPWLDNSLDKTNSYYRTIHWDVRLHILAFFLLPMLTLGYFRDASDFEFDNKVELIHNLLHMSFISVIWMSIAKGNTLFSYVLRGHIWHSRARLLLYLLATATGQGNNNGSGGGSSGTSVIRGLVSNRVSPTDNLNNNAVALVESAEVNGNESGGGQNNNENQKTGLANVLKNILMDYFPVNLIAQKGGVVGVDQGSISTGTCTSLLNRRSNNSGSADLDVETAVVEVEPEPHTVELETSVKPEEENDNRCQVEEYNCEERDDIRCELVRESPVGSGAFNGNKNIPATTSEVDIVGLNRTTEVTFATDVESQAPIRLKRCPSTALPVMDVSDSA